MALFLRRLPQSIRTIHSSAVVNNIFKVHTVEEFEEKVLKAKSPIVVDFFATWCAPCKMLTPRIESVIGESKNVSLAKVDIDENSDLALNYNVSSVPVLVAIKNGTEITRMVGLQDTDKIRKFVDALDKAK